MKQKFTLQLIFLLLASAFSVAQAQGPQGRLFFHINASQFGDPGALAFIDYPAQNYQVVDSVKASDLVLTPWRVAVAAEDRIYLYDQFNGTLKDSIMGVEPFRLDWTDGKLCVISLTAPHFRVYSGDSTFTPLFTLDSTHAPYAASDLTVWNNRAFFGIDTFLKVVDLDQQAVIGNLSVNSSNIPNLGGSGNIAVLDDYVYLHQSYPTGVPRFTLFRTHANNLLIEEKQYIEGFDFYNKMIPGAGILHLGVYPAQYDPVLDTVTHQYSFAHPLAFDYASNSLFVMDHSNTGKVSYYQNGSEVDSLSVPASVNFATWLELNTIGIDPIASEQFQWEVFPNPADDRITIRRTNSEGEAVLHLNNNLGQQVRSITIGAAESEIQLEVSGLAPGVYIISIQNGAQQQTRKLVIR